MDQGDNMIKQTLMSLALCVGAASLPCHAQSSASDIERGRALYMENGCFSCHGTVGQGSDRSGAPKLAPDPYPYEAFRALVRTPRETMPRLDVKHVSDEQLQLMHRFLASLPKGASAKDIPVLQALQVPAR
jgi:ubiquinol-cytochrome c reductase cytochrome c subunit